MRSERVTIGKIVSPHGVKGLFQILVYSENEDSFFSHKSYFKVKNKKIDIIKKFNKGNFIVCESATIQSREQVTEIINEDIVISHDFANKNSMKFIDFLEIYSKYNKSSSLALNIKSNGLQTKLKKYLDIYKIKDYFVFFKININFKWS